MRLMANDEVIKKKFFHTDVVQHFIFIDIKSSPIPTK